MSVVQKFVGRLTILVMLAVAGSTLATPSTAFAQAVQEPATQSSQAVHGGEANLVVPDLSQVEFRGVNGRSLLMSGLVVCALGLLFGLMVFTQTKNLPVH